MIFNQIFSFLTDSAGIIAVVLYVAGVLILLHSMRVQDKSTLGQTALIMQLRDHLAQSIKAQVELHDHVNLLHQRYTELLNRQQRVETRTPDSRRIDTAMRMLRRGTADPQTLQDLGLSNGEAKLLLRLHGTSGGVTKNAPQQPPASTRIAGRKAAANTPPAKRNHPAVSDHNTHTLNQPVAAQGRALAQLLEA